MRHNFPASRLSVEVLESREVPATVAAVNLAGRLLTFDSNNPSVILSNLAITGLAAAGERITDIDVQTGSGTLFGRSDADRLYTINPFTGSASRLPGVVGTVPPVGMDFDPTSGLLRVVSNDGTNVAINPTNGAFSSFGTPLAYLPTDVARGQPPRVTGLAFTNSLPFALTTTAFGIDQRLNTLVRFNVSINSGQLVTVGSLGIDTTALVGFDIAAVGTVGFAVLRQPGSSFSVFATINLNNGAATVVGPVGNNRLISDIAVLGGSAFPIVGGFVPPNNAAAVPNNTSPLFPTLTQQLPPGLVSPGFGFTSTTSTSSAFSFTTGSNLSFNTSPLPSTLVSPLTTG